MVLYEIDYCWWKIFNNYQLLKEKVEELTQNHVVNQVICGEATGADSLGKKWAEEKGISVNSMPADWGKFGKSAGFRRNTEMADCATHLIAFWDGKSKGTKHMIDIMKKKGLPFRVVRYE